MRLHDGTILQHGSAPYDPVKAHEYYLRVRKLKGREPAAPSFAVTNPISGKTVNLTGQQLVEQKAYAAKRVADIKRNLAVLGAKLREARAAAKKKDDGESSAAEKSKARRESKQYRKKHKQEIATKQKRAAKKTPKRKRSNVEQLEHQVAQIRKRLTAAVAIQKALSGATRVK